MQCFLSSQSASVVHGMQVNYLNKVLVRAAFMMGTVLPSFFNLGNAMMFDFTLNTHCLSEWIF